MLTLRGVMMPDSEVMFVILFADDCCQDLSSASIRLQPLRLWLTNLLLFALWGGAVNEFGPLHPADLPCSMGWDGSTIQYSSHYAYGICKTNDNGVTPVELEVW
jgi:hypothetical protein